MQEHNYLNRFIGMFTRKVASCSKPNSFFCNLSSSWITVNFLSNIAKFFLLFLVIGGNLYSDEHNMLPYYEVSNPIQVQILIDALFEKNNQKINNSALKRDASKYASSYAFDVILLWFEKAYSEGLQNREEIDCLSFVLRKSIERIKDDLIQGEMLQRKYQKSKKENPQNTSLGRGNDITRLYCEEIIALGYVMGFEEALRFLDVELPALGKRFGHQWSKDMLDLDVALIRKQWLDGYMETKKEKDWVKEHLKEIFQKAEWRFSRKAFAFLFYVSDSRSRSRQEISWFYDWRKDRNYRETMLKLLSEQMYEKVQFDNDEEDEEYIYDDGICAQVRTNPFTYICKRLVTLLTNRKEEELFYKQWNQMHGKTKTMDDIKREVDRNRRELLDARHWAKKDESWTPPSDAITDLFFKEFGFQYRLH